MPLTIYSRHTDSRRIMDFLAEEGLAVEGTEEKWSATQERKGGFLKRSKKIRLAYDKQYCSAPNWDQQIMGMQGFYSRFPIPEEKRDAVMQLIRSLQCTIGIKLEPEMDSDEDPRFEIVCEVARQLDGVIFLPNGCLVDPEFRTLISPEGESDPEARFPEIPDEASLMPALEETEQTETVSDDEENIDPPDRERVLDRMHALTAVAARGLLDMNLSRGNEPAYTHEELLAWIEALDLEQELEPEELERINTPAGELEKQEVVDMVWRLEGLAVLAWAVKLTRLPRYDSVVDTDGLLQAVGFDTDVSAAQAVRQRAEVQSPDDLQSYNNQAFALHWRMVDFKLRPEPIDFEKMQDQNWFRPLDLSWADLIDRDLALQGEAIAQCDAELVATVSSIASERHTASNWLMGQHPVYSQIEAST